MSGQLEHILTVALILVTQGLTWQRVHSVEAALQERVERRLNSNRRLSERRASDRAAGGRPDSAGDELGHGRRRGEDPPR